MLASFFIANGVKTVLKPERLVESAEPIANVATEIAAAKYRGRLRVRGWRVTTGAYRPIGRFLPVVTVVVAKGPDNDERRAWSARREDHSTGAERRPRRQPAPGKRWRRCVWREIVIPRSMCPGCVPVGAKPPVVVLSPLPDTS